MSDEPFDFARYFTRVHSTPLWHGMHVGMAEFGEATRPGLRVLDVGCGPGRLVHDLQQRGVNIIGVDADTKVAAKFRTLYPATPIIQAFAESLPCPDNFFDRVVAGNILFFLPDPLVALREMVRVTRPGGIITTWNPSENMSQATVTTYADSRTDLAEFERKHLINWAGVAENNRRWRSADLASLFAQAQLTQFETKTVIGGLARYARGTKA